MNMVIKNKIKPQTKMGPLLFLNPFIAPVLSENAYDEPSFDVPQKRICFHSQ